jgi:hypothetical protein
MNFILLKNKHDSDMYDICTKRTSGGYTVWGSVHGDFISESGLKDAMDSSIYYPDAVNITEVKATDIL